MPAVLSGDEGDPRFCFVICLDFVDGDVLHSHRILLGYVRTVWKTHWIAIVEDPALAPGRTHLLCRRLAPRSRHALLGLRRSVRHPMEGTMPCLSAGTEANGRRGGEDD